MNELKESTANVLSERIRSPFLGTFVLVWVVSNWKFLAFLFMGENAISERISSAESTLAPAPSFYVPIAAALLYTFVWPWAAYLIERYQSSIKFLGMRASVKQEDQIDLQKLQNRLAKIRYETNEQRAVEKLLKSQAAFKELLEQQKAFISEADEVLQAAEERAARISGFNSMLHMFERNYDEFLRRTPEEDVEPDAEEKSEGGRNSRE